MNWLILIHQIPAKPSYFRAKIWRRLQQTGAVPIKQAVYVMPCTDRSREDLGWIVKEIMESGGDAVLAEASFQEGLNDEQVINLFQQARQVDYENLLQEIQTLTEQHHSSTTSDLALLECNNALRKLRKTFADIKAIDFFPGAAQAHLEARLVDLETTLRRPSIEHRDSPACVHTLKGKTWVTRENIYVDRMASAWFIRRFIDAEAKLKFVRNNRYQPDDGEVRFDMVEAEFTHKNEFCTFEVLTETFTDTDEGLQQIAKIIHDIDIKDDAFGLAETAGIKALFDGILATVSDDNDRVKRASHMLDELYAYYRSLV